MTNCILGYNCFCPLGVSEAQNPLIRMPVASISSGEFNRLLVGIDGFEGF